MANGSNTSKTILIIIVTAVIAIGAYVFLTGKDNRTTGERVGDAVDSFSETGSLDRAGEQLNDQSPAEKLGNAIEDKTEEMKAE